MRGAFVILNIPLWMTREFVQEDCYSIDGAGAVVEVCLNLFWGCAVVDVAYEDGSSVDIFTVFP